jgi:hypothetical protein
LRQEEQQQYIQKLLHIMSVFPHARSQ